MIDVGELEYNGWTFPPTVQCVARAQPVLDAAQRHTKHVLYTIEVEMVLYPGVEGQLFPGTLDSVDGQEPTVGEGGMGGTNYNYTGMDQLRLLLLENGKPFKFVGKGLGFDLDINTLGDNQDVMYGPKVKDLQWEPIGANKCVRVRWIVEVAIANCPVTVLTGGLRVTELTSESNYSIDDLGLVVRTVTGRITIANRMEGQRPVHWVDTIRNQVKVTLPPGFKRESQNWTVDPGGTMLAFRFVDKQHESTIAPHYGIVSHDVQHRVRSVGKVLGHAYTVSVTGTFRVAPGATKGFAWAAFLWFVKSRRDAATKAEYRDSRGNVIRNPAIPLHIEINDSLTSREISFSIAWMLYSRPTRMLDGAGFLDVVQGSDWQTNLNSLAAIQRSGGFSQLRSLPREAVTACGYSPSSGFIIRDTIPALQQQDVGYLFFDPGCKETWLKFEHSVEVDTKHQTAVLYPTGGSSSYSDIQGPEYPSTSLGEQREAVIHQRSTPRQRITFRGKAAKIGGQPIKRPKLKSWAGIDKLTPIGDGTWITFPIKMVGDCPLHSVYWIQDYEVEGIPTEENTYVTDPDIRIP